MTPTSSAPPPASAGHSQPTPPGLELTVDMCPICLEERVMSPPAGGCGHVMCASCLQRILRAGYTRCPVCRARLSLGAGHRETDTYQNEMSRYVVLQAPTEHSLGMHQCTWAELERRLGIPSGQLAGNLQTWMVQLRRVATVDDADFWWRETHTSRMPRHD